ncbi:hypothetical protein NONO_c60390 [Nocardia nova SH22a]|uniref:Uncharacterized protein n=1 Tax=Nocardia nova SH22a TaxID=1415166 RepID=W5TN96_9NOCA|nr:hypothetical protein [Nocardia nova]AHH20815.1 hypothetical protein NONO_c60390 [Nocardia nova SH22a]
MSSAITDAFLAEYARVSPEGRLDVIGGHTTGWHTNAGPGLRLAAVLFLTPDAVARWRKRSVQLRTVVTCPDGTTLDHADRIDRGHRFIVAPFDLSPAQHGTYIVRVQLADDTVDLPLEVKP